MIEVELNGIAMKFKASRDLFSPNGLDAGTNAMLSCVSFSQTDKVLDLGCGYGIVGIYAAKLIGEHCVTMVDIDETAIAVAKENACLNGVPNIHISQSDGFKSIDDAGYTIILSNPPYHTNFSVAKHFIEKGFNRLVIGGRMVMVTKRKDWYKNKFIAIFGGVSIKEIDGYFVFIAEKRSPSYAKNSSR
jgi:16S rRNA (guanine1207-N2)-methyltransferase